MDYEDAQVLNITVNATGDGPLGLSTEMTFRLTIEDVNDPPIVWLSGCGHCNSSFYPSYPGHSLGLVEVLDDEVLQVCWMLGG